MSDGDILVQVLIYCTKSTIRLTFTFFLIAVQVPVVVPKKYSRTPKTNASPRVIRWGSTSSLPTRCGSPPCTSSLLCSSHLFWFQGRYLPCHCSLTFSTGLNFVSICRTILAVSSSFLLSLHGRGCLYFLDFADVLHHSYGSSCEGRGMRHHKTLKITGGTSARSVLDTK